MRNDHFSRCNHETGLIYFQTVGIYLFKACKNWIVINKWRSNASGMYDDDASDQRIVLNHFCCLISFECSPRDCKIHEFTVVHTYNFIKRDDAFRTTCTQHYPWPGCDLTNLFNLIIIGLQTNCLLFTNNFLTLFHLQ